MINLSANEGRRVLEFLKDQHDALEEMAQCSTDEDRDEYFKDVGRIEFLIEGLEREVG